MWQTKYYYVQKKLDFIWKLDGSKGHAAETYGDIYRSCRGVSSWRFVLIGSLFWHILETEIAPQMPPHFCPTFALFDGNKKSTMTGAWRRTVRKNKK